ncbi:uncharacterized protein LOC124416067 [Diprion similis]|uniref:uncharacterized protein LOC124416067 n=1 Tax=Diprion similis TaxID=362088 RepID=UPI001EF9A30C|nr:uncharacterized protein LOC124416067 [Diprion similis]
MIWLTTLLAIAIASTNASPTRSSGCSVSLNGDLNDPQPLILVPKGQEVSYVLPVDTSGTLVFAENEELRLACVGDNNYLVGVGNEDVQDIEAYCVSDKTFLVNSVEYEFGDLVCSFVPSSTVRRTGEACLNKYSQLEIGFDLGDEFLRTIEICRDDDIYFTYWTKFNLTKTIGGYQRSYPRPSWSQGDFWGDYNVNTQFTRSVQRATVSLIVNSTDLGATYISSSSNYYFARGHITAKADFVYGSAHWSTFWYVNCHPQWQTFNGANWMYLESDVRDYASNSQVDLDVYTGVHGITTLLDVNNLEQPIYFYASGDERALPVPKFFWKIIYDPLTQKGTAFVGVNNPYITEVTSDYYICDDISSKITWLTWTADSIEKGISYACTIDDLREVVPTLPELTVVDILT